MGQIKLGTNTISNIKLGSLQVSKAYLGNNLIWTNASPYSAELTAIITRANLEGFSLPDSYQLSSIENLISAYKTSGVWNKMDRIYNFAYNNSPNMVKYSQEVDNAVWIKSNVTISANTTTAPDTTMTADKIVENATNSNHLIFQTFPAYPSTNYTMSFYLKAAEKTSAFVNFSDGSVGMLRTFNITGGTVDNSVGTTITSVGSGWYHCVMTRTTSVGGNVLTPQFYTAAGTFLGDGVSGYYIWGIQIERGSTATTYYKTPNTHLQNWSRIDWKNPSTSPLLSLNGGLNFVEQGFMGNGVDAYIDTGFIPSTHGVNYTQNNASRTAMVYTIPTIGNTIDGGTPATNNCLFVASTASHRINTTNVLAGGNVNLGGAGMKSVSRDNSTVVRFYNRTTESAGRTATSDVFPSQSQYLFRNVSNYSNLTMSNYLIGASITSGETVSIRNDFNTYLTDIGITPNNTL